MIKPYLCERCGETDPVAFPDKRKTICKKCLNLKKLEARRKKGIGPQNIITQEIFENKIRKNFGNRYSFEKAKYINSRTEVILTCIKHNYDFSVKPKNIMKQRKKRGKIVKNIVGICPKCYNDYRESIKQKMFAQFRKIHNNQYDYIEEEYINNIIPFTAICKTDGTHFKVRGKSHREGCGKCPKCYPYFNSRETKIKHNSNFEIINNITYYICDIHGRVIYSKNRPLSKGCPKCAYDKQNVKKQKMFLDRLIREYGDNYKIEILSKEEVKFTCKKHGIEKIVNKKKFSNNYKRKYFCDECRKEANCFYYSFDEKKKFVRTKIENECVDYCKIVRFYQKNTGSKYFVELENINNNKKASFAVNSLLKGKHIKYHTIYRKLVRISYEEAKVRIKKLGITSFREYKKWHIRIKPLDMPSNPHIAYKDEWVSHYEFFDINSDEYKSHGEKKIEEFLIKNNIKYEWQKKYDDCRDINSLPFDFYLPEYNLIIEFDGKQHFKPVKKYDGQKGLEYTQKHDKIKNKYCADNNIHLLRLDNYCLKNQEIGWNIDIKLKKIKVLNAVAYLNEQNNKT